ncbi:Tetratricopeptide repeat (TPR)-like superfamily protein [Rhynchospora pubera]|uniref:Tetratricopeptide repeat (TPR)-like superfamily protein n=1 Tax=Rhynchospora pubera TaxID=906938 RepID=A0AAV8E7N5_9POAL|nr:Tetratricopeptide repeat (TPR)-like superfamily protein [Rhynchospora pubera]
MFPHLSSLNTSSPLRIPSSVPRKHSSVYLKCKCMQTTPSNNGNSEPPLLITSNSIPEGTFLAGPVKFDFQPVPENSTSVPFSLRFVQLRKKHANLPLPKTPPPNLCSLGTSVLSLASLIVETQRLFFPTSTSSSNPSASCDTGYSIIWLFQKVFVASPVLTVGILGLMAEFVRVSLKSEIKWLMADVEWEKRLREGKKIASWSEIGITMQEDSVLESSDSLMSDMKRISYERLIVSNQACSLILSNYAQFLYQIARDYDRAEEYFKRSVEAEPVDGEAMSRYALFLWQHRGDLEKAEEMFLKASDVDPDNSHHLCTYARFLWMTGGTDTCVPPMDGLSE